ncbi:suppressor of fused domain protein [Jatrophihabitans sp.]|uniref:suppressor of fused domain protein n=1 Tax=Jatrophihabitans sp. TaxID=1932789 RepID=UPI0030C7197B|nr:Suppressor of fused protein [Jatrophihabitans sp.]
MAHPDPLSAIDEALREHFGHSPVRASVSFVGVEPIDILRFEPIPGERAYLTLGMARHPMTSAADPMLASDGPRAELMLHISDPADRFVDVWRQLAVLGAAPAVEGVVYSAGMTVDLGQPLVTGSLCTGAVLTESAVGSVSTGAGPVEILQVNAATQNELAWSRVKGSAVLRERWAERGVDLLDLGRGPVDLD